MAYVTRAQLLTENEQLKAEMAASAEFAEYKALVAKAAGGCDEEKAKRLAAEAAVARHQMEVMQLMGRVQQLEYQLKKGTNA